MGVVTVMRRLWVVCSGRTRIHDPTAAARPLRLISTTDIPCACIEMRFIFALDMLFAGYMRYSSVYSWLTTSKE